VLPTHVVPKRRHFGNKSAARGTREASEMLDIVAISRGITVLIVDYFISTSLEGKP